MDVKGRRARTDGNLRGWSPEDRQDHRGLSWPPSLEVGGAVLQERPAFFITQFNTHEPGGGDLKKETANE